MHSLSLENNRRVEEAVDDEDEHEPSKQFLLFAGNKREKVFEKDKKCVESMKAERLANLMNGRVMWMKLQWPSFVDRPLAPSLLPSLRATLPASIPTIASRGRYVRDRLSTAPARILIPDIDWKFGR